MACLLAGHADRPAGGFACLDDAVAYLKQRMGEGEAEEKPLAENRFGNQGGQRKETGK